MENKTLRKEFFKKAFKDERKNPNYKKIKDAYVYDHTMTGRDANKLFDIIKYTKTGAIKKTSVGSVEKFNKMLDIHLVPFKAGQTMAEMNVKLSEKKNLIVSNLIDAKQINTMLANLDSKKKYVLNVETKEEKKIYMINPNTRGFAKMLNSGFITTNISAVSSDEWATINSSRITNTSISEIKNEGRNMNRQVLKFPKFNTHPAVDLSKYQIYTKDQKIDNTNCLIYSLTQSGISQEKIKKVIMAFSDKTISSNNDIHMRSFDAIKQKDFKKVSDIIETSIKVSVINVKNTQKTCITYGKNYKECINLAISNNHIFLDEETIYKKYAILNYDKVKDKKHAWYKYNGHDVISAGKKLSSLEVIDLLEKNNMTEPIPYSLNVKQELTLMNSSDLLCNMDKEQRPFEYKQKEEKKINIYYADLENINNVGSNSTPFLAGIISSTETTPAIYEGNLCILNMFYYILNRHKENTENIVYFHNLKYDFSLMKEFIFIRDICEKDNQIYSGKIIFRGITITLKDSYKMFSKSLAKFQPTFNLDKKYGKKEYINYDYYNIITINNKTANIVDYFNNFSTKDKEGFMTSIEAFKVSETEFKHIDFYKDYLINDVKLLQLGMQAMNTTMVETFQLSIFDYLTISSYADAYFKLKGCYNNVYEVCGGLKKWMAKAIYGGRVNCNEKYKKQVINKTINDFDGVSLYPSAISRLCDEYGMAQGNAKRMTNLINIMKQDYYIVDIQITKINKKQMNPFIAIKNKQSIKYINEITEPTFVTIDKYTLEDYISFHDIEYTIIDGIYYNEGFNKKFKKAIDDMFNNRAIQKALKTPSGDVKQELYKLMMNSAYGKTIMKSNNTKNVIVNNEDYEKYLYNNFHCIEYAKKLNNNQHIITIQNIDETYNRSQCGIAILSMSKRIMNEVMDISSNNNLIIYYQDTDSMHMNDNEIKELSEKFEEKYNRTLIGKNMGQFHSDFNHSNKDCQNVVSVKSIFLGKKAYIDYLEGVDSKGVKQYCVHARMKGINEISLLHEARKLENKDMKDNVFEIYEKLADNKAIEFVLNPAEKVAFKFTSSGVQKRETSEFKRVICFKDEETVEDDEEIY